MKTAIRIVSKGYFNSIQEFHMEQDTPLGIGSFGTVRLGIFYNNLGIHLKTSRPYAIKIVNKLITVGWHLRSNVRELTQNCLALDFTAFVIRSSTYNKALGYHLWGQQNIHDYGLCVKWLFVPLSESLYQIFRSWRL